MRVLGLALAAMFTAQAQDEAALRRFFEGKLVRVKIEMPATHHGVDVHVRKDPPVDFPALGRHIKTFGIALDPGQEVRITAIKVKKELIEFQLGGGGYGTWGDDSGSVYVPSVSKSSRESQLEKDVRNEADSRRKQDLQRELSYLKSQRERDEQRRRVQVAELETIKKAEIAQKRREAGSRFNLRYPDHYLAETVPTPQQVMAILGEWVDFSPIAGGGRSVAGTGSRGVAAPGTRLKKGMSRDEVIAAMGVPTSKRTRREGQLEVRTETWDKDGEITEIDFVDDVVLKYRISTK